MIERILLNPAEPATQEQTLAAIEQRQAHVDGVAVHRAVEDQLFGGGLLEREISFLQYDFLKSDLLKSRYSTTRDN